MKSIVVMLAALAIAGCKETTPHIKCVDDSQCTLAGRPGVCAAGSCATYDRSCPSGQRYDTAAGASGECVPPTPPGPDMAMPVDMADRPAGESPDMAMAPSTDMAGPPADMARGLGDNTWATVSLSNVGTAGLFAVWGTSSSDLWAVGCGGLVLHAVDGAWSTLSTPGAGKCLYGVWGSSPKDVWVVGDGGFLMHLENGTWITYSSGTGATLASVWGVDASHVWAAGRSGAVVAYGGAGTKWAAVTGLNAPTMPNFSKGWSSGPADVYVPGLDTALGKGSLAHYAGAWDVTSPTGFYSLYAAFGTSSSDVWVSGSSGSQAQVEHWDGAAWSSPATLGSGTATAVWASSKDDVWAVTTASMQTAAAIVHNDAGTWNPKKSFSDSSLNAIYGFGPHDVWAVGQSSGGPLVVHGN